MNGKGQPTIKLALTTVFFALGLIGSIGCSLAGDQILPAELASRIASHGTTDDHLIAAQLYEERVRQLEIDAARYARIAASITALEDTKGFRRSAMKTAAQERQRQAQEMLQLVSEHQRNAKELTAQQRQQ